MHEQSTKQIQSLPDMAHLSLFANRLLDWLLTNASLKSGNMESRAKALLKAANVIDDPTLHSFTKLAEGETAVRCTLYDLLDQSGLGENPEVAALAAVSSSQYPASSTQYSVSNPSWLALALAAHAWKTGYSLVQLDPASPPNEYSPAGQVVKRAAHLIRQQVQRGATERDKLGKKLGYVTGTAVSGTPSLDQMPQQPPIAPIPPHFRPPIPVRYPEVARDTLQIQPAPPPQPPPPAPEPPPQRSSPLSITDEDLMPQQPQPTQPTQMPSIRITRDQIKPESPSRPRVVMPQPKTETGLVTAVRQKFAKDREPLKTTKLRVIVQEYPDGPGYYGLQVRVTCQGIRSHVAGTTNREGKFLCELPVRIHSGLTYEVEIVWPRDLGGDIERKTVTLNADRTEFTLPFHRRSTA